LWRRRDQWTADTSDFLNQRTKRTTMKKIDLLKFQAPLTGGPDMSVRRLAITATQLATALQHSGERYLRELKGILGDFEDEPSEAQFAKLEALLGDEGARQAMMFGELIDHAITEMESIQNFSINTTTSDEAGAAASVSGTRDAGDKTTAEGQPTAGSAPDAGTSGGAAVDANVSSPTLAAGGGSPVGSGTASTPAAGSDATSTPGSAPGVASGPAAGAGPSSSDDGTKAATPAGKPKGKRGGGR
jgi:hypothetical protein